MEDLPGGLGPDGGDAGEFGEGEGGLEGLAQGDFGKKARTPDGWIVRLKCELNNVDFRGAEAKSHPTPRWPGSIWTSGETPQPP